MSDCFLRDPEGMTDLVSIPDELLGNVQELPEFFRHGDVGGLLEEMSNEANVSIVPYSHERFPTPIQWRVLVKRCKVSSLSNWLRALSAKRTAGRVGDLWAHECPLAALLLN